MMRTTNVLALLLAVIPLALHAEELRRSTPSGGSALLKSTETVSSAISTPAPLATPKVWKYSVVALVGATSFDAASSWGKHELNPVLQSRGATFGAQGTLIKAGIAGVTVGLQIALRHHPAMLKAASVLNFVQAGVYTGVGVHNLGFPRAPGVTNP
jgi:hypothetical protein